MATKEKFSQYKNHQAVPKELTWDLDDVLKGESIDDLIKQYFQLFEETIEIKDSKYNSLENFYQAHLLFEKKELIGNRISNYLSNNLSINVVDSKFKALEEKLNFQINQLLQKQGSEINRIFKNEEKIREYLKDERLQQYCKEYFACFEEKKHKLSDEVENFLIKVSRAETSSYEVFSILTNSELKYEDVIDSEGKKHPFSEGMRLVFLQSKDALVRKNAYWSHINGNYQHRNSLAQLLYDHFKKAATWAKARNYSTAVDSFLFADRVDSKLLKVLYRVCKKNRKIIQKYKQLHKHFYEKKFNKPMEIWDSYLPLVEKDKKFTVEEAQKIVLNSLEPMGKTYHQKASDALLKERWVDYMPIENKRSGAYSIGNSFGLNKKYILMNFDGTLRSVETLSHELGHSMHSFFSDKKQPYNQAEYPIFLAEIASIFNELMLSDYLLSQNQDDLEFQFNILNSLISTFDGTVMRQTAWSNFEFNLYEGVEKGEPLSSFDQIADLYFKNAQEYTTSPWELKPDSKDLIWSVIVPHFYYGFYVYKYAIGQICANIFYEKYKKSGKQALQNYIDNFLSQGGSDWPLEILKKSGIDLYDENTYETAFKAIEKRINKLEKIGKKIF